MASIIAPVNDDFKERLARFDWVNWSEVAREELNKRRIFEEYKRTRTLSKEDEEFCERIDWHPVDELPLKKEFVEEVRKSSRLPKSRPISPEEFKRRWGSI